MKTILIGGYYGAGNLGDEAILECMLKDLRALRSDLNFIVLSWNPERTCQAFGVESLRWQDISLLIEAAKRADLILLGGGGLFQDYWGLVPHTYLRRTATTITTYGSLPLLAKLLGIPCMIYAQGVGPLKTELAREHVRQAFERCQTVTVRDEDSLALLQACGFHPAPGQPVEVTADPVFTLTVSGQAHQQARDFLASQNIPSNASLVSVSLRYWKQAEQTLGWVSSIAAGLNACLEAEPGAHLLLLPFQVDETTPYTDDRPVLRELASRLTASERVHMVEREISPQLMQALFEESALVIGMRLHALILAVNAGTPAVAIPYDPKVTALLKQLGLQAYALSSLSPTVDEFLALAQKALRNRSALAPVLREQGLQKRQLALKNAQLALQRLGDVPPAALGFSQQFALQTLEIMETLDVEAEEFRARVQALETQLENERARVDYLSNSLQQIQSSRFWKLTQLSHRLRDRLRLK